MLSTRVFLDFATDAAWQAGRLTLPYFQTGVEVERKTDGSPVTAADRAAEAHLRRLLEARFPDHDIVGEEMGASGRGSTHRWYIDPIDGTQSFVRGVPLYGVLLGLQVDGEMVVGVAAFPALGEVLAAASGLGCSWNGRPARVSAVSRLSEASLSFTDSADLRRRRPGAWDRLQAATRIQRGWSDCYGHCLVATGRVDVMLDPIMNPWDCAALLPILREAGGTFTDWNGSPTIDGGHAISTNGVLFDEIMEIVREP
ncbi:MAG: histidinol-phosphatase [Acidobacteria bacterium]|nr:histidinol-phosphatase [Acidobacteriota bacterium]MBI3265137.1 histidinol-phosphatase [Acidobacteriota bacterium]